MAQDAEQMAEKLTQDSADVAVPQEPSPTDDIHGPVHAVSARKPGVVERCLENTQRLIASILSPRWDFRTAFFALIALIMVLWLWRNWAPWRVDFLVGYVDLPLPIWFLINLALGAVLLHIWRAHGEKPPSGEDDAPPEQG